MWPEQVNARGRLQVFQCIGLRVYHGLFDEHHRKVLRQSREQVLRPLVDEIPAQVRKDDEVRHGLSPVSR
jgi:hypothetical protein